MTILEKITAQTKEDIARRKRKVSASDFRSFEGYGHPRKDFFTAVKRNDPEDPIRIIAEVKKASPSKGVIRADFNPLRHAEQYIENGASAISVLTDVPFFQGELAYMESIAGISPIPVLRKDFIVDFYQIEEARAHGADALLLIATILDPLQLRELHLATEEAGLQVLVECYDEADFAKVPFDIVRVFGVNNRDLNTFKVDVHRGISLLKKAPEGVALVSESGLSTPADLSLLKENGIDAALIGESFMKKDDPGKALREILSESRIPNPKS